MPSDEYATLAGRNAGYRIVVLVLAGLVAVGLAAAHYMDENGHHVTGMNNQIVWGVPHVVAVFLIVASSGALNVASLTSVFRRNDYAPLARLSGVLAIALLVGGLAVLVLDLGRPERLMVALTHYNFRSVFAWNVFLYTGFLIVVAIYLWLHIERRLHRYTRPVGVVAFAWRIVLTSATGSIFGFLVARPAYDAALFAPLFVAMSLAFGLAFFVLVALATCPRALTEATLQGFRRLLVIFVLVVAWLTAIQHLTNLYVAEHHDVERFLLIDGGIYTWLFWLGQGVIGTLLPLALLWPPGAARAAGRLAVAALLVTAGGLCQLYVIIVGGQAWPLEIFPGKEILESSFFDGRVGAYLPSAPELALGGGGIAFALLLFCLALRVFPLLPQTAAPLAHGPAEP